MDDNTLIRMTIYIPKSWKKKFDKLMTKQYTSASVYLRNMIREEIERKEL